MPSRNSRSPATLRAPAPTPVAPEMQPAPSHLAAASRGATADRSAMKGTALIGSRRARLGRQCSPAEPAPTIGDSLPGFVRWGAKYESTAQPRDLLQNHFTISDLRGLQHFCPPSLPAERPSAPKAPRKENARRRCHDCWRKSPVADAVGMSHFLILAVTVSPCKSLPGVARAAPLALNGLSLRDGVGFTGIEPGIMRSMLDLRGLYAKIRLNVVK